jgi:DNA-binding protein Fis
MTVSSLRRLKKPLIMDALNKVEQNQTRAAELLGISRQTLVYRMQKYNIK